jgi:hypothetical protein
VEKGSIGCDRLRLYMYVYIYIHLCCVQIMYKFQEIPYPLRYFSAQENTNLCVTVYHHCR